MITQEQISEAAGLLIEHAQSTETIDRAADDAQLAEDIFIQQMNAIRVDPDAAYALFRIAEKNARTMGSAISHVFAIGVICGRWDAANAE